MPNEAVISLLRAVNVGGTNILPMADLRAAATATGLPNFRTYIQSGNCVYDGPEQDLAAVIRDEFGLDLDIITLTAGDLDQILTDCPYDGDSSRIHVGLCGAEVTLPDTVMTLRTPSEDITTKGRALYLSAPDGVGRSKLFAALPGALDQPVTMRNLKTLRKLQSIAQG